MISILSHDVRDPLASIQTVLEMHSSDFLDAESRNNMLDLLKVNVGYTLQMIKNLVEWSSLQLPFNQGNSSRVNTHHLAEECIKQTKLSFALKKNEIVNSINPDLCAFVNKDAFCFVLRNLVSNANKFTENGVIKIYDYSLNDRHFICVEDNGLGIETDKLKLIFEQNVRHSSEGTKNEKGSGIGLTLIKNYLKSTDNTFSIKKHSRQRHFCFLFNYALCITNCQIRLKTLYALF